MKGFIKHYVRNENLTILDIGSRVVNSRKLGNYRDLFKGHKYYGLDILSGENVDIIIKNNHFPFKDREVDIVISGSTFEHVEYPWELIREMARVLKVGGLCCIVAPYFGGIHRMPFDTFRYFPDGLIALAKWANLAVIESEIFKIDTYLIAKKL